MAKELKMKVKCPRCGRDLVVPVGSREFVCASVVSCGGVIGKVLHFLSTMTPVGEVGL